MMKRRAFLFLIVLGTGAAIFATISRPAAPPGPARIEAGSIVLPGAELTDEAFEDIEAELILRVKTEGPMAALQDLRRRMDGDPAVARSCHMLAHEIGHASYETLGDFGEAMKRKDEVCNSGYIHGVIESHFAGATDVQAEMKTACRTYPSGSFIAWECHHGLGHGAMFASANDLPASLRACDGIADAESRASCANGVFMENFNTDRKLHPSTFLKADDPSYPCAEQEERHKEVCYGYAPTFHLALHPGDYLGALGWCGKVAEDGRMACIGGVGSQAMKENIGSPEEVEDLCGAAGDGTGACIFGMVELYINHHGSTGPAEELCGRMEKPNAAVCLAVVAKKEAQFARDP